MDITEPRGLCTVANVCVTPELFVIPPSPIVNEPPFKAIVKALATGLNTTPLTLVSAVEIDTPVVFELSKVATSVGEFGTVAGVQLAAVFQSPLEGLRPQVALPATASWLVNMDRMAISMLSLIFTEYLTLA